MSTFTIVADEGQAALFLALTALVWGDWYAPTVTIWSDYQLFKLWRDKLKSRVWLPPMVFFAIVIVIMYAFLQASLYVFFINVYSAGLDPYWVPFTVLILFAFFLMFIKRWLALYMIGGQSWGALGRLLGAFGCAFTVTVIYGVYGHVQELCCLIPYWIFWLGALYLNFRTLYEEENCGFKSAVSREKWYKETAAYDLDQSGKSTTTGSGVLPNFIRL